MKVTVCELPDDRVAFVSGWEALVAYVRERRSDLALLPELPFGALEEERRDRSRQYNSPA